MDVLYLQIPVKNINYFRLTRLFIVYIFAILFLVSARDSHSATSDDLHYTKVGFFDIHVCNWPNRPLFFLTLFSTYNYNDILNIQIFSPDNKTIGELDLNKYRIFKDKKKKEKRVFIKQFEISADAKNGWYYTKVNLKNGSTIIAKDYVIIDKLNIAKILSPDINQELKTIPKSFTLMKIKGAQHYQAFIHDKWDSELIFTSKLLNNPEIHMPENLLKKGGLYTIQIHARDTNEHQLLGDFNHGSLTNKIEFSITE
ncbi:MAG: hypothetical protein OEW99_04910 [Gammaproteobacteria bacterium]|nr:hypothetical protein [Gammaproteobacteria bacterium]